MTAPAERDGLSGGHLERAAVGVEERDRADDLVRPVRANRDRDLVHGSSVASGRAASRLQSRPVALRICLVTPHAWSVPHDTNEHVAGLAHALRARGAPHRRAGAVVALEGAARGSAGAAGRASRRRRRARPRRARLSPVGGRDPRRRPRERGNRAPPRRLRRRPRLRPRRRRPRLRRTPRGRDDDRRDLRRPRAAQLSAAAQPARQAPRADRHAPRRRATRPRLERAERFPGEFAIVPAGVDLDLFEPLAKEQRVVIESSAGSLPVVRAVLRALRTIDGWEAILLRTGKLAARPSIPLALRGRVHVRTALTGSARAEVLQQRGDRRPVARRAAPAARRGGRRGVRGRRATRPRGPAGARGRGAAPSDRGSGGARARRRRATGADRGRGLRCRRRARRAPLRGGAAPPSNRPAATRPSPSPSATGSSSTSTCTRTTRTTARSSPPPSSPMQRPRARRDRGDRPQRLQRARSRRSRPHAGTTSS